MSLQQGRATVTADESSLVTTMPRARLTRAQNWFDDRMSRCRKSVYVEVGQLTPDLAQFLLARNENNRDRRPKAVAQWEAVIRRGDWELNGTTVVISDEGLLNDGQHRCTAVVNTQTTIPMIFVFGVQRKARYTVDRGTKRDTASIFKLSGIPNWSTMAASTALLYNYDHDNVTARRTVDITELERYYAAHPGQQQSVNLVKPTYIILGGSVSAFTCAHYIFQRIDKTEAIRFFQSLGDALFMSGPRDPVNVLRRYLIQAHVDDTAMALEERLADLIVAWNARRVGGKFKKWERGAAFPEAV